MKKSILILALAALFGAGAEPVSPEMAKAVANAWVTRNAQFKAGTSAKSVFAEYDPADASVVLWYQVSMFGGGCLMVAPDTEIEPIVAALDNDPGVLPATHPLRAILTGDMRARLEFLAKGKKPAGPSLMGASPLPEDNASVVAREWGAQQKSKWAKMGVGAGAALQEAETVGVKDPIATEIGIVPGFEKGGALTHWNQSGAGGYNLYTPGKSVCGCVATATSALIQFFKAPKGPEEGTKNQCSYNGEKDQYEVKGGDYDWSILPSNWGGEAEESKTLDDDQKDLIGRVAYDAGVCHGMSWSDGESGAFTEDTAHVLRDYFGFKEARLVKKPKQEQYKKLIYMQCWCGVPVGMGIKGHAVVAVGYGKDADGVDRVRVFMGWGGAGDGWYALPYIDTKATMNGGTYLSEVVNSITTMISLEDDCVVPVCGMLIPTMNAPVTVGDVEKEANNHGYFGLRLSAADVTKGKVFDIACQGKSWTLTVAGDDPAKGKKDNEYAEDAVGLCAWIPDDLLLPLINTPSATTFDDAKTLALSFDPPRPVLAFSGTWGEETTDLAWKMLQDMDDANEGDFTNRFIVLCQPFAAGDKISDGNPSISLFDPAVLDSTDRWAFYNGRLAYWSVFGRQFTTNETLYAELYNPTNNAANRFIDADAVSNGVYSVLAATNGFDLATAGIIVVSTTDTPGTESTNYCFAATNEMFAGEITLEAPEVITNEAQGVVWECAGWTVSNMTAQTVVASNETDVCTATFAVETNAEYQVLWTWTPVAYKLTVEAVFQSNGGQMPPNFPADMVTPAEGWYAPGETVDISAVADFADGLRCYRFNEWSASDEWANVWRLDGEKAPTLSIEMVEAPVTIKARYVPCTTLAANRDVTLAIAHASGDTNALPAGFSAPATLWGAVELMASGNAFADGSTSVKLAEDKIVVGEDTWVCSGYVFAVADGAVSTNVTTDGTASLWFANPSVNTLTWLWVKQTEPEEPEIPEEFVIDWNSDLTDLNSRTWQTNLLSSSDLAAAGLTADDIQERVKVPKGWKATVEVVDPSVTVKLQLDTEALQKSADDIKLTIYPNADETLTVHAEVPAGVRGFWYSIYGTDDLTGGWTIVKSGQYESGTPSDQARPASGETAEVVLDIIVNPTETKRFYKVVVDEANPQK